MPRRYANKTTDIGCAALRVEMAVRGWCNDDLAKALGVNVRAVTNNWANDFSSKAMRIKVNERLGVKIFTEGIGI